jgi:hypothetical protein
MTCHQGRQSMLTINATVAAASNPQALTFSNVHYFPAGATQYSNRAAVGYMWTGIADQDTVPVVFPASRKYAAPWNHFATTNWANYSSSTGTGGMPEEGQCSYCHMQDGSHKFEPETGTTCRGCHGNGAIETYRKTNADNASLGSLAVDFDGDPLTTKLGDEVALFRAAVEKALDDYAVRKGKLRLCYDGHTNPYWFKDANNDNLPDDVNADGKIDSSDRYNQFDKYMLYAAHNYQLTFKDPGSWAHNPRFTLQILYDSIDYLDDEKWNGSPVNPVNASPLARPVTN